FCSINLSRCEELRYPSKCYCKRKPTSLNFDIYFNFTLDVIHSHAEIRMKLLTDNTPVYSNVRRLPTIYQRVPLTLTVNGFEVEPRNCIFKVNASDPKVEFCCDADHLPCYSAIMRNGQVVADFNSSCAVLEDARPLRASYVFKYNVCSEKDKKLQFACKPLLVNSQRLKKNQSKYTNIFLHRGIFGIVVFVIVAVIIVIKCISQQSEIKEKSKYIIIFLPLGIFIVAAIIVIKCKRCIIYYIESEVKPTFTDLKNQGKADLHVRKQNNSKKLGIDLFVHEVKSSKENVDVSNL
ncbi:hypothetical protein Bpfe_003528, partial [Biomphalaria pfeifferi]